MSNRGRDQFTHTAAAQVDHIRQIHSDFPHVLMHDLGYLWRWQGASGTTYAVFRMLRRWVGMRISADGTLTTAYVDAPDVYAAMVACIQRYAVGPDAAEIEQYRRDREMTI